MDAVDRLRSHPVVGQLAGATPRDSFTVITSLTLGILVFRGYRHDYFEIPFQLLFVAFLLVPRLRTQAIFWFLIACFSGAALWLDWRSADNHKYLLFYWLVTVFLVCKQGEQERPLMVKKVARYLLCFTMTLAVAQKSLSPDYLSGDFFQFVLMTDERFSAMVALFCGIAPEVLEANRVLYRQASDPVNLNATFPLLFRNEKLVLLAGVMTWLNYLIEAAIAVLVLLPLSVRWSIIMHLLLIGFIAAVYAVAPVLGFGWLLVIWGYCLAPNELVTLRLSYIALFLLLCVYEAPWLSLLV